MFEEKKTQLEKEIKDISNNDLEKLINENERKFDTMLTKDTNIGSKFFKFLIFILFIGILVFSGIIFLEINKTRESLQKIENNSLLASNTYKSSNLLDPISGTGFTIILEQKTDLKFVSERKIENSDFLDNRIGIVTEVKTETIYKNTKLEYILEVKTVEYDNKFNQEQFTEKLIKTLNNNYKLVSKEVLTAKGYKLWKIATEDKNDPIYYTFVNTENYYIIKIKNDFALKIEENNEYKNLLDKMLLWMYLN